MAANAIIAVLSQIPWGQVVDNAPKVADGAAKLWKAVSGRMKSRHASVAETAIDEMAASSEQDVLQARVSVLEENVRALQEQMQASTELIKTLADQNALLIQRLDLLRRKMILYAVASGGVLVLLAGVLVRQLTQ
ncbi:hypothetical protein BH11PSE11_BH11PSE11_21120 [soil metagenome]